jgi:hypothetical protein
MKAYKHLVEFMLAKGYVISVGSEGVTDLKRSDNARAIIEAVEALDMAGMTIVDLNANKIVARVVCTPGVDMADEETVADHSDNPLMDEWSLAYGGLTA